MRKARSESEPRPLSGASPPEAALERWVDEGGAKADGPQTAAPPVAGAQPAGPPTAAEWAELRTRVIALENLVIALLSTAPEDHRRQAREMADFISPRPGFTNHRLTSHAAHRMTDLINRARRFEEQAGREA